ncbi:MAG: hypothetical protein HUU19_12565 [Phycisphaerales bacterium]|nr:hypothetical protein [Phycisphaerales bacterium]
MAEEGDKGKMIKIGVAALCLLVGGYLIAANQGWVPAFWGSTEKPKAPVITEDQQKEFEQQKKKVEEMPEEERPGA